MLGFAIIAWFAHRDPWSGDATSLSFARNRMPALSPCSMRLFIYNLNAQRSAPAPGVHERSTPLSRQLAFGVRVFGNQSISCLEGACVSQSWGNMTARQYTGEVPIYQRLLQLCPVVNDPTHADLFVVPFFFGFLQGIGWSLSDRKYGPGTRAAHGRIVHDALGAIAHLDHLNRSTAHRHLFLFSTDAEWCCPFIVPASAHASLLNFGRGERSAWNASLEAELQANPSRVARSAKARKLQLEYLLCAHVHSYACTCMHIHAHT